MPVFESDVCVLGGGISAAMLSKKLLELRPNLSINVVEAGNRLFDFESRMENRRRSIVYGENAWPGDFIGDQKAAGIISRTMAAGGSALHWGGTCNRFSEEDLRLKSMFGLYTDWPLDWEELEHFYCEAEHRLGVSGEPSPLLDDRRSQPYPMPAMILTHNLSELKKWGEKSGIPFWSTPQAKNTKPYDGRAQCIRCNTCLICPTGARYSPDFTYKQLLKNKKFALHDRTLVRRLEMNDKSRITEASAVHRDRPEERVTFRAPIFVVAAGYTWSSHLLLLSQNPRFPNGIANSSGLVGKYMCGHEFITSIIELDAKIYPGMNETHALISRQFFRCKTDAPYVRHDLRIWESSSGREPRLKDKNGDFLLGDDLLNDWRSRQNAARRGCAAITMFILIGTVRLVWIGARQTGGAIHCRKSNIVRMRPQWRASHRRENTFVSFSKNWRQTTTAKFSAAARGVIGIIQRADAAWEPTPPQAFATASAKRTIMRICS